MKLLFLTLILSIPMMGRGQQVTEKKPEFDLYEGLLYSSGDMQHLKKTVDSLNLRYLECVPNPVYRSWPQTQAKYIGIEVKAEKAPLIEARLKQDVSLQQLLSEFPEIKIKDSAHVILAYQTTYDKYDGKYVTTLYSGTGDRLSNSDLSAPPASGNWVYSKGYEYENISSIKAWLLDAPFKSIQLPQEYAKMIQYVDCMIDTSTKLMLYKGWDPEGVNSAFDSLKNYVRFMKHKELNVKDYYLLSGEDEKYLREEFHKEGKVRRILNLAMKEALENGRGDEELEELATGLYSKDTILLLKRSRLVMGNCSMDDRPRQHARDIAILASQTHQWPVFIKAHLNIMNDRFARLSDGSYAERGRGTYFRELEMLNIPLEQLLLGSIFRANDLASEHYFGDLSRVGRAFTESAHTSAFEKKVKSFLVDKNLDPFNQCLFFMVYASYCYGQPEEQMANTKINELKTECDMYPEYIREVIIRMD